MIDNDEKLEVILAKEYLTRKQIQEHKDLCKDREQGRILTPNGLIFICEAYHYEPEAIGRHLIKLAT